VTLLHLIYTQQCGKFEKDKCVYATAILFVCALSSLHILWTDFVKRTT